MKTTYKKSQPKIIIHRSYKYFNNESFREKLLKIEAIGNNCDDFNSSLNVMLIKHAPRKKVFKGKSITFHEQHVVKGS